MATDRYSLANLASVPQCLTTIASWQHQQWLLSRPPTSAPLNAQALSERCLQLRQHLAASLIPVTFVVMHRQDRLRREPVGSVSLVSYRATDAEVASIWLTNMYVVPEHRHQGLATALLQKAEDYARSIQVQNLSLFAQDAKDFYLKRRWLPYKQLDLQGTPVDILIRKLA